MHQILEKYIEWKKENDEDYQYDEIHNFIAEFSRGEWCFFLDLIEKMFTSDNSGYPK